MQTKRSKNSSKAASTKELRFLSWCKNQNSIVSGNYGVEVHHCAGSTAKTMVGAERVQIGHWYCIPLTPDEHWLYHNRKSVFIQLYGNQWDIWERLVENYPDEIPQNIRIGIAQYGR